MAVHATGSAGILRSGGQLNAYANQIETEAIECKLILDQLLDLLNDLADLDHPAHGAGASVTESFFEPVAFRRNGTDLADRILTREQLSG